MIDTSVPGVEGVEQGPEIIEASGRKKLSPGEIRRLKDAGYDIHELKDGFGPSAHSDLYKDKEGNVYIHPKGGGGPGDKTDIKLKEI
ncbi:MAG: hypothetical protein HRT90_09555 [Candidatus Margulisbacteria bacterium]|nr:hypothetical protein [Candidatus Margulisiibacteriota bacterium]